jgi:phosphatidylserine decarboxylase
MSLALGWGRLRRAWLRTFWPGYVRRMVALRQGSCPDCPHDIVDPRDLEYVRNVCGYWFRPEDDRFTWRGRLGLARCGFPEILCSSIVLAVLAALLVVAGLVVHPWLFTSLAVVLPVWLFVLAFFRDPHRIIPVDPDLLLSPADGTVTHLEEVEIPDFPGGRAFRVSIFLSVFNVHVNRIPRSGRVTALRYYPGAFLDARDEQCHVRNEQFWIDLEDARLGCPVRLVQVAGAIARRIVCWLKPGEAVAAGARLGMIKFGSRADVLVPSEVVAEVLVKPGDVVQGGNRPLLRLRATM